MLREQYVWFAWSVRSLSETAARGSLNSRSCWNQKTPRSSSTILYGAALESFSSRDRFSGMNLLGFG